jgi:L-threonylcarbamoyladenylate synthase
MNNLVESILSGGLVVMPTDTVFGIVASAFNKKTIERLYEVRGRDENKPCIILCAELSDLDKFDVKLTDFEKEVLEKVWPNSVSVVVDCPSSSLEYLHRGLKTLAFRVPKSLELRETLRKTGPILAPSANPQGKPVAKNLEEAKKYFGQKVDLYVDGEVGDKASTLISFEGNELKILREGAVDVKNILK